MTNKLMGLALPVAAALAAQPAPPPPGEMGVFEHHFARPAAGIMLQADAPAGALRQMAVEYIGGEGGAPGQVVKGMPYSAESVSETTQTFADGNRIHHKGTSHVYRDAEGRTRREPSIGPITLAPDAAMPQLVFINDPVSGYHYVLDVKERSAQKMKIAAPTPQLAGLRARMENHAPAEAGAILGASSEAGAVHTMTYARTSMMQQAKTESLGRQNIEGVDADGTRTTWTIPAGEIGNDRPIEVVNERWYSPELQTVVVSRHSDPRMGETVFRLTNISRTDPPRSLFEPPADYKVTEGTAGEVIRMRLATPAVAK